VLDFKRLGSDALAWPVLLGQGCIQTRPKKLKLLQSLKISSMNELDYGSNSKCPSTFFPCSNQAFINVQKVAEQENIKDKNEEIQERET
jgi:hypothetical protein